MKGDVIDCIYEELPVMISIVTIINLCTFMQVHIPSHSKKY